MCVARMRKCVSPSLRAKRSNPVSRRRAGLLRRYAPRNDGVDWLFKWVIVARMSASDIRVFEVPHIAVLMRATGCLKCESGNERTRRVFFPLPLRERVDRIEDARRVRGSGVRVCGNPSSGASRHLLPQGEKGRITPRPPSRPAPAALRAWIASGNRSWSRQNARGCHLRTR